MCLTDREFALSIRLGRLYMYLKKYSPSPELSAWVRSIQIFELKTGSEPMFVPAWARSSLVFHYGDLFTFQWDDGRLVPTIRTGVLGAQTQPLVLTQEKPINIKMLAVDLHPLATYSLLGGGLGELNDRATSFSDVLAKEKVDWVSEALSAAQTDQEKLQIVETFLLRLFQNARHRSHPLIGEALRMIHRTQGRVNIEKLSKSLGFTERHLRREFGRTVGLSPKKYTQLLRIEGVINRLYIRRDETLSSMACDFGYHDEAHMINDVKKNTFLSPGEMVATGYLDWLKLYLM